VDTVLPLGAARDGDWAYVEADIRAVVDAAGKAAVKVVLETAALEPVQIVAGCLAAVRAGAAFVMTSTGFHGGGGASLEAVMLMRHTVGPAFGVKASGGVRTGELALRMLAAGANRIGTSAAATMTSLLGRDAAPLGLLLEPYLSRGDAVTTR
jgi:deoxyribose-phosphate aldolase